MRVLWTRAGLAGAGLALVALGGGIGWVLHRPPAPDAKLYAQSRTIAVQVHLDEAVEPYVFLAGDSHAELQSPAQRPCGAEIVNGGVSGANAALYAGLVEAFRFPRRARAAALTIGTNDILAKNRPRAPENAARFEAAASRIVARLQAVSDRVVVTALPPVGRELGAVLDAAAVPDYSARLKALCERMGCRFADPFAASRDGEGGYARPGAMRDGLHMAAYRPVLAALSPSLCDP